MTDDPWTIGRLLAWTIDYLGQHGAENPRLDAEVLLASARACKRIDLYASYGEEATDEIRATFRELVRRRAQGTPVAYLVGHKEFYSLDFEVTPDVLIPRPETELLVVALVDHVKKMGAGGWGLGAGEPASAGGQVEREFEVVRGSPDPAPPPTEGLPPTGEVRPSVGPVARSGDRPQLTIADVGTGSGILAVCAAKFVPNAHVTATDISPAALEVAKRNAERHGVAARIEFKQADLLSTEPAEPRFDFILSNPPYVSTAEMADLPREVRDHEPHAALHAGQRGTEVIERLIEQSIDQLQPGGVLIVEVSPMIAPTVEDLIKHQPTLELGPTLRDLADHPRVVQAIAT